jgi:hypothetical protein
MEVLLNCLVLVLNNSNAISIVTYLICKGIDVTKNAQPFFEHEKIYLVLENQQA